MYEGVPPHRAPWSRGELVRLAMATPLSWRQWHGFENEATHTGLAPPPISAMRSPTCWMIASFCPVATFAASRSALSWRQPTRTVPSESTEIERPETDAQRLVVGLAPRAVSVDVARQRHPDGFVEPLLVRHRGNLVRIGHEKISRTSSSTRFAACSGLIRPVSRVSNRPTTRSLDRAV
jgi:hypothetical protein